MAYKIKTEGDKYVVYDTRDPLNEEKFEKFDTLSEAQAVAFTKTNDQGDGKAAHPEAEAVEYELHQDN